VYINQDVACKQLFTAVVALAVQDCCLPKLPKSQKLSKDTITAIDFILNRIDPYLVFIDVDPVIWKKKLFEKMEDMEDTKDAILNKAAEAFKNSSPEEWEEMPEVKNALHKLTSLQKQTFKENFETYLNVPYENLQEVLGRIREEDSRDDNNKKMAHETRVDTFNCVSRPDTIKDLKKMVELLVPDSIFRLEQYGGAK